MAKARIDTGAAGEGVHTRTTGGPEESQVVVLGIDGSDSVAPTDATEGLKVNSNAVGTTADASSASTVVGRLKKLVELLTTTASSFLAVRLTDGASYLGTVSDRLKVDVGGSLPTGTNAIGSVTLGAAADVSDRAARQLGRLTDGAFAYAAGTATGNVDVPTGARIKRVSVIAGAAAGATVTILGGSTITVPAGGAFDEQIPGDATATSGSTDVVIGGTIQSYYVAWVS